MAEQTFRSPGFFEKEIDLSSRKAGPSGTPAGIIGTAQKGPAFVPVTIGTFADFEVKFGGLSPDRFGPYAVNEFLKHRDAVTYMRVLGAGANSSITDIQNTKQQGTVKNAGFVLEGPLVGATSAEFPTGRDSTEGVTGSGRRHGTVQFLCAAHTIPANELVGFPSFSDNDSFEGTTAAGDVRMVRAMIMSPQGSRVMVAAPGATFATSTEFGSIDDFTAPVAGAFQLLISSSLGQSFSNDGGVPGLKIFNVDLDPSSNSYVGKVLNTDPDKFLEKQHYLYADFPVESELASLHSAAGTVGILSGSDAVSASSPLSSLNSFGDVFGRFDTRYTTPTTPWIISQPFGENEHKLFRFETLSDGQHGNDQVKISIANLRASTDPKNKYATFEVQVRRFLDNDYQKETVEAFPEVTLDPNSDKYIAKIIGDYKVVYNFDAETEDERRLVISGKYPNRSQFIRVVMHDNVTNPDSGLPQSAMPFGFLGVPTLKTNDTLTDGATALSMGDAGTGARLSGQGTDAFTLSRSVVPPLPMRFKCTRGEVETTPGFIGEPGELEKADARLYWGVKFEKIDSEVGGILNTNTSRKPNHLISSYTKFVGIQKLDTVVTGSGADAFNNNKFSLANVALGVTGIADLTSTPKTHMLDAAYIRNATVSAPDYTINDSISSNDRISLAKLVHEDAIKFNRFNSYAKFTLPFYGGFDGLNMLNRDNALMTDRASSSSTDGMASVGWDEDGLGGTQHTGEGKENNIVSSYRAAITQMTDPLNVSTNILAIPGIRDPFVTNFAAKRTKEYSKALYVMDIANYDSSSTRMFIDSEIHEDLKPDVRNTAEFFDSRGVDNNYVASYFPDVTINDESNNLQVQVPASVAAVAALAYNDSVSYPWFAPAGFNRGALSFVSNVATRLSAGDRDTLYDARINPIAIFPSGGYVIFGQKTLQMNKSALDRVNVRRMLLEVKRQIVSVANNLLFEPNTPATRGRFIASATPLLALIQAQAGIEKFQIVMDSTNNSQEDYENNRLNGRIVVVPTRAIEFIAIDFIITNSGVIFA